MSFGDFVVLAAAGLLLFLPGGAMLLALTGASWRTHWPVLLGASPVATVAVAYVSTVLTHAAGIGYGLASFLATALLAVVIALGVRRLRGHPLWASSEATDAGYSGSFWTRNLTTILGLLVTAVAALTSVLTWARGLGTLATVPQEHDTITHTLMTAYIARTGNGAPGDTWPIDLLSGEPDSFYPQGFHAVAALVVDFGVDPVTALNAMMVAVFAFAVPCGMFALGSLLDLGGFERIAGGAAAFAAVVAYRPVYALMHDGGILANAIALSLTPAAVAVLVAVLHRARSREPSGRRRLWREVPVADTMLCALVIVGAFAVHPTSAALVGVGALTWVCGDLILQRPGWGAVRTWALTIGVAAAVAGIAAIPILVNVLRSAGTVIDWPRDFGVTPLPQALGVSVGMPYAGFLDPNVAMSQPVLAGLSLLGVACALVTRRHGGLLLAWFAWLIILLNFLGDTGLPFVTAVAGLFYNSYVRISGGIAPYQWLLIGVAVVSLGRLAAAAFGRVKASAGRGDTAEAGPLAAGGALVMTMALIGLSIGYVNTNADALAGRYADSDFFRVDDDDRAAIRFLADNVEPGERVMNNANDGSTFLYIYAGIDIVETTPLAISDARYTEQLLLDFGDLDTDSSIQDLVRRLNIHWVYFDTESPPIGSRVDLYPWWGEPTYSIPPAFEHLDEVDSLTEVFTAGSVAVYHVDDAVFR